jgi:predicted DNA-binding transcriptional regulator AlpA
MLSKPNSEYVAVAAAAEILGVSVSFLNKLRCYGGGPRFQKIGGRAVRYNLASLREWADSQSRRSTSDERAA